MKFLCRNCKAKYQIADEKVAGRTLRMICQQCGEPVVVRGPSRQALVSRSAAPAPIAVPSAAGALLGADLTQLAPSARPPALPDEWHVAINDAPVGPLSRDEVARKIAQGVLDRESLAWRDGMDDWLAIKHIADLASLFSAPAKSHARQSLRAPAPVTAPPTAAQEAPRAHAMPAGVAESSAAARAASLAGRAASAAAAPIAEPEEPRPSAAEHDAASAGAESTESLELAAEEPAPVQAVEVPAAAATQVPAPAGPSAAAVAAARRPPAWAQWFVIGSAVVFTLAIGALLGVRFLGPPTPAPPSAPGVTAAPAPRPAPTPAPAPEASPATEPEEAPSVIALDPQAVDGANKPAHKAPSPSRPAQAASAPDKKRPALSAEDKALLDKMRGDLDHGPTNLRATHENARTQAPAGTGQLTAEQLSQVVLNGRKNLQRCYETALRGSNTNETVRMDVDIQVSPSGNVTSVRTSGKGLPGMDDCIVHTVQMWRFPMSAESTQTRFPVVFQPGA